MHANPQHNFAIKSLFARSFVFFVDKTVVSVLAKLFCISQLAGSMCRWECEGRIHAGLMYT